MKGVQSASKLLQFAKKGDITRVPDLSGGGKKHGHHSWPQYLLGPETQELYGLDEELHKEYHRRLDKELPRRIGTDA
jgi:hypothetical protein